MRPTLSTVFAVAVLAASLVACGDNSPTTAPTDNRPFPSPATSSVSLTDTETVVTVLGRTTPVSDIIVSKVIGPSGGTITIPAAGLTLTVPALAVSVNTTFQVHALPGTVVAYEFEPHGMKFKVALTVTQALAGTSNPSASGTLNAGYFSDKSKIDFKTKSAAVDEVLPTTKGTNGSITFQVKHFSGYLVSSG
jgi:hypothetical protein